MSIYPRLLLIGDDLTLLQSREMLLGSKFVVEISARLSEALSFLRNHPFELVVFLTITENWRRFAGFTAQQVPPPKILAVTESVDEPLAWADAVISPQEGPYALVKQCEEMFGMARKTRSQGFSNKSHRKPVLIT